MRRRKPETTFRKAFKTMVKKNPDKGVHVTSMGYIDSHGKPNWVMNRECAAWLSAIPITKLKAFWIYQEAEDTPLVREWITFVLGDKSPWRDIVKRQPYQSIDQVMKYGFILTDLRIPTNFVVDFLMGFRLAYEKPGVAKVWSQLVRDGIRPGTAAFLTDIVYDQRIKDDIKKITFTAGDWHSAFAARYGDLSSVERVNNGRPLLSKLQKKTFYDTTQYQSTSSIWKRQGPGFYNASRQFAARIESGVKESNRPRMFSDKIKDLPNGCNYSTFLEFCRLVDRKEIKLG